MMMQASYTGSGPPGVFNVAVTEPTNGVFNTQAAHNTVMVPQPQCAAPQQFAQNFPQTNGGYMWVQAVQPMTFWSNSNSCEGMQASEFMGKNQAAGKQQQVVAAEQTASARRQQRQRQLKRSLRSGNAAPDGAPHPEKMQQLQRAEKNTEEAGQIFRGRSGRFSSSSGSEDGSSTRCSDKLLWADAFEDEFPAETLEQVPLSWGDFRDECLSQTSQRDPCLADVIEAEFPSDSTQQGPVQGWAVSRRTRAAAAKDFEPMCSQASGQVHDNASLQDDSPCPEAAADQVLLALEDADSPTFRSTLDEVASTAWWLAWTKRGSRLVQKAIEVGTDEDQKQILGALRGRVLEALKSPHANHVLQKCIEVMSPDQLQFAVTEIQHDLTFVARHRFGCRILQRLIEHGHPCQTEGLISELVSDAARLCRHQFGNFAIQHILQHGAAAQRSAIAKMLCADAIRLAKHRIASYVISCALSHCAAQDVQMLTQEVLQDAGQLADLSRRQYGSFVVREVHRAVRLHEE
jgi:hypothetical protein